MKAAADASLAQAARTSTNVRTPVPLKVVYVSMDDNVQRAAQRAWTEPLGVTLLMAKLADFPERGCVNGTRGNLGAFGRAYLYPSAYLLDAEGRVRARYQEARNIRTKLEADIEPTSGEAVAPSGGANGLLLGTPPGAI